MITGGVLRLRRLYDTLHHVQVGRVEKSYGVVAALGRRKHLLHVYQHLLSPSFSFLLLPCSLFPVPCSLVIPTNQNLP